MWSASPETEKYHIFLTIFRKPQQHQEQILSTPQLLTTLPTGSEESELMSELAAGEMFCPCSWVSPLPTHKTPFVGSHVRGASVAACNGNGKELHLHRLHRYSAAPGPPPASETQSSQARVEALHVPCGTRAGRETSAVVRQGWGSGALERPCPCPAWCSSAGGAIRGSRGSQTARWAGARPEPCWAYQKVSEPWCCI